MSHLRGNWEDPYAESSDASADERDPGDEDVMYAQVQPMSGMYASTGAAQRPAAAAAARSPPAAASRPGHEPLMYSPRSTRQQQRQMWGNRPSYRSPQQQQQQVHAHGPDRRMSADSAASSSRYPMERAEASYASFAGRGGAEASQAQEGGGGARVGVGVMLDGSGNISHDDEFHDSLPEPYEQMQAQLNRSRRSTSTPPELVFPPMKEGFPKPPTHHHAIEPTRPPPRRSRRYQKHAQRHADVCEGTKTSPPIQGHHVVMCDLCQTTSQVPTSCVLLKCPRCQSVSSAMPLRSLQA